LVGCGKICPMDKGVERPDTTPESDIDSDRLIRISVTILDHTDEVQ